MANLNETQETALAELATIDEEWRLEKLRAEDKARKIVAQLLAQADAKRAQAVYRCHLLRIPKVKIGKTGLHTTDPATVNDVLKRFEPAPPLVALPLSAPITDAAVRAHTPVLTPEEIEGYMGEIREPDTFEWVGPGRDTIRLHLRGFQSLSKREGFPAILQGLVQRDPDARSGWKVLEDPTDEPTEHGPIPGFLRQEIDRNWYPEEEEPGRHLPTLLNSWAGVN